MAQVNSRAAKMTIYLAIKTWIILLLVEKIIILAEYLDFTNVFLKKSVVVLFKLTGDNEHEIKLEKNKQPFYKSIYSLEPVKLEIFKIYIETNLANGFIRPSKLLVGT